MKTSLKNLELTKYRGTDHLNVRKSRQKLFKWFSLIKIISTNDQKNCLGKLHPHCCSFHQFQVHIFQFLLASCSRKDVFPTVPSTFSLLLGLPWIPTLILPAQFLSCSLNLIIYVVNYLCCSLSYLLSCWYLNYLSQHLLRWNCYLQHLWVWPISCCWEGFKAVLPLSAPIIFTTIFQQVLTKYTPFTKYFLKDASF